MSNPSRSILAAAAVLVAVALGYVFLVERSAPDAVATSETSVAQQEQSSLTNTEAAPTDAPVLTLEVAGQANGIIRVAMRPDLAPNHVAQITELAKRGAYDGVAFHRVIEGFMAQTGDVQHGKPDGTPGLVGTGGSNLPDLDAEFTNKASFERGVMGMARSANPNSANSQFFLMFAPAPHLDGQYTIVGEVIEGLDVLDAIKRGEGPNGAMIGAPDRMTKVTVSP
ncbi:MAG: peptidylprolyl isomerase [Pseudomonadota bacterium]